MPCPKQRAWGGVDKRYTMPAYGVDQTTLRRLRRPATWLFLLYTRLADRRLAGQVARDIGDYVRSGQSVQAVVGVGGSPACGVRTTLNLRGCWTPSQAVTPLS
jgi:predicted secreted protein